LNAYGAAASVEDHLRAGFTRGRGGKDQDEQCERRCSARGEPTRLRLTGDYLRTPRTFQPENHGG
jgi:hypothetical protein